MNAARSRGSCSPYAMWPSNSRQSATASSTIGPIELGAPSSSAASSASGRFLKTVQKNLMSCRSRARAKARSRSSSVGRASSSAKLGEVIPASIKRSSGGAPRTRVPAVGAPGRGARGGPGLRQIGRPVGPGGGGRRVPIRLPGHRQGLAVRLDEPGDDQPAAEDRGRDREQRDVEFFPRLVVEEQGQGDDREQRPEDAA